MSEGNRMKFAVTGITGRVGSTVARALLEKGHLVRAVVRDIEKAKPWIDLGCDAAVAAIGDAQALAQAFMDVDGVFLMIPPDFDPEPGFPELRKIAETVAAAVDVAKPGRLVLLSTVGAHVDELNLLNWAKIVEETLRSLSVPTAFLRAAWFMENSSWDVSAAKTGIIPSFLQPLDHMIPMIATADVGQAAAELLLETWTGNRIIELEAVRRYSANDIGAVFEAELGREVSMEIVPHEIWEELFRSQGANNPIPRIRMIDGFNEGWIDFEGNTAEVRTGKTPLEYVIRELISKSN